MAEYEDREHYIPLRKSDLVELLCHDKQVPRAEVADFRQFCTLISAVFHFEYLERLERLKDAFAPRRSAPPFCKDEPRPPASLPETGDTPGSATAETELALFDFIPGICWIRRISGNQRAAGPDR